MEWAQRTSYELKEDVEGLDWKVKTSARLPMSGLPLPSLSTFLSPGAASYRVGTRQADRNDGTANGRQRIWSDA